MFDFKDMMIGKKIGLGYGIITFILMGVVLTTIQQVKTIETITKRVVELRTPTAHASLMMLNGINHSLASLRGWIILGDQKFQTERALAWAEQINPSLKQMHELATDWTDQENKTRLKAIEKEIDAFKMSQQKIEDIAQTPENSPAQKILFDQAEPLEKNIVAIVSKMIKLEMKNKMTTQNKRLIGVLANIETTISLSLERADEFLLSGKQEFKKESQENWNKNVEYMKTLQESKKALSGGQSKNIEKLQSDLNKLGPLMEDIIRICSGEECDVANHWVQTQAAPTAFRIKELLNEMTEIQEQLLENDVDEISSRSYFLIVLLVALFFVAALISRVLATNITRSISGPILSISTLADELVRGNSKNKRLPVQSRNELGTLSHSFNELLDRLQENKPIKKD